MLEMTFQLCFQHFVAALTWGDHCLRVINTQNDFFAALHGALWRLPILG